MGENENDEGGRGKYEGVGGGGPGEREGERFFTANRPEGFNHSKRRNSYWGYQNFLQEQLCQTVAPQQCPSPK